MGASDLYTRAAVADWVRATWALPDVREVDLVSETSDEVTYRVVRDDGQAGASTSLQTFRLAPDPSDQS